MGRIITAFISIIYLEDERRWSSQGNVNRPMCQIKNHPSSFHNLKLKRFTTQRSVDCENECHNKIVPFTTVGISQSTSTYSNILFRLFVLLQVLRAQNFWHNLALACQLIVENFWIKIKTEYENILPGDERRGPWWLAVAKHQISKWRTRNRWGLSVNMAKSNLNEEAQ